jgi:hypothetical protein
MICLKKERWKCVENYKRWGDGSESKAEKFSES